MVASNRLFNKQLEQLEHQINRYQGLLSSGFKKLQFPPDIEKDYSWRNNANFIKSSRGVLSFGILLYLAFGFADFSLGQGHSTLLWYTRVVISGLMLSGIALIFSRQLIRWVVVLTAIGMTVIGLSVIAFMSVIEAPYSYAYHLGMIPWQVFILIALRANLRAILISSLVVFSCYVLYVFNLDIRPYSPEVDQLILDIRPLFVLFWALLIAMGVYLGYFMEQSSRIDYVKNRLLSLDSQRLTLLSEELHLLSTTDGLTGLANRRQFEDCFQSEWRRAVRSQDSVALIMIDVDYFKNYNDYYGHQAGDECLKSVCHAFKSYAQRSGELIARYGGEEFIVLLPRMTLENALHIAESMCLKIRNLSIEHEGSESKYVTISIGVAAMIPTLDTDVDALLKASDKALYRAKANGRNQVAY